jgi:hypothetical protein
VTVGTDGADGVETVGIGTDAVTEVVAIGVVIVTLRSSRPKPQPE